MSQNRAVIYRYSQVLDLYCPKILFFDIISKFYPLSDKAFLLQAHDTRYPSSTDSRIIIGNYENDYIKYGNTVFYPPNFPTLYKFLYNRNLESAINSLP